MNKLSEDILDEIDGGEERRGRDSQLTEWVERARALERDAERYRWMAMKCFETPYDIKAALDAVIDAAIDAARR